MRQWFSIQGLRALAVLLVVGAHEHDFLDRFHIHSIFQTLTALESWGVDLFFVISGFVMMTAHWNDFDVAGSPARFLMRRAIRIFPMYWLVTLLLYGLFSALPGLLLNWVGGHSNLALSLALLVPRGRYPLLWVGWTLVFEMYFYYVFAASLNFSRRLALTLIGGWAALIVVLQFVPLSQNIWYKTLTDGLVLEFTLGVLAGTLVAKKMVLRTAPSLGLVALACVALTFAFHAAYDPRHELHVDLPLRFLTVGMPMALLLYGAVCLEARKKFAIPATFLFLGDASYSIYLTHAVFYVALGRILSRSIPGHMPAFVTILVVPIAVVLGGCAVYRWVERPLLKLSRARAAHVFPVTMARRLDALSSRPA